MIFSFKRSGEGERDRVVSDFDMDELNDADVASGTESDTEQPEGGHCRMDFVKDKQAYIIYVWYQLEHHDLMRSSLQELDAWLAALQASNGAGRLFQINYDRDDNSSVQSSASKSSRGSGDFEASFCSSINNLGSSNLTIAQMEGREKQRYRADADAHQRTMAMIEERKCNTSPSRNRRRRLINRRGR
ncbi:hypothetical protein ACHAWO_000253 [Cyclotella atomus]|uniref:PH domain-containing protein n=1 Tax=Cyclotella atomus TaxID=382360 RepID=A0ABD3PPT8_9STRA